MARNYVSLGCLLWSFFLKCCGPCPAPAAYRVPILETVIQENVGARNVPEAPDNFYIILGAALLHFRVLGDVNIKVVADGVSLPRRAQATGASGWYEPNGAGGNASRSFFWDIAVPVTGMQAQMIQNGINQGIQHPPNYDVGGGTHTCDCASWPQQILGDAGINTGAPTQVPKQLMNQLETLYPQQQ